jgi:hypothetical protein
MKLRLKEDAREWRKFGLGSAAVLAAALGVLAWRGTVPRPAATVLLAGLALVAVLALARPAWFRGPYRGGMRLSHLLGQIVAPVVLGLIFLLVLTPLGLLLRLLGKDLLRLRRNSAATSYWQPPPPSSDLTRMY